jgi:DNA polymerase III subunit chi
MTGRVDFYVLKDASPRQGWTFACRLTEKAYGRTLKVAILTASDADARLLDDMLWTFSDRSFVPHEIYRDAAAATGALTPAAPTPAAPTPAAPAYLTADPNGGPGADLLINLSNHMPSHPQRFERIAEIIDADAERKRLGRERFKCYRELELSLETHQIDAATDI